MGRVGDLVQEYIDHVGYPLSSRAIGKKIHVTGVTIDNWRSGASMPNPDNMRELAKLLGVPLETVIHAALRDAGYLPDERNDDAESRATRMSVADATELGEFNEGNKAELLAAFEADQEAERRAAPPVESPERDNG